jgi:hypothetical protein
MVFFNKLADPELSPVFNSVSYSPKGHTAHASGN